MNDNSPLQTTSYEELLKRVQDYRNTHSPKQRSCNLQYKKNKKKLKILLRDNCKCVLCPNTTQLTFDHIVRPECSKIAWAKRRKPRLFNLEYVRTLCLECHMKKNKGLL